MRVFSDPPILVVAVQCGRFAVNVVCFHAPHSCHNRKFLEEFWDRLESVLSGIRNGCCFGFLADADATLGSRTSTSVGSYYAQEQDYNGHRFHLCLCRYKLYAPNTFDECCFGADVRTYMAKT